MNKARLTAMLVLVFVTITCHVGSSSAQSVPGTWLAGDLHVHTTYSHDSYGGPSDTNTGPEEVYTLGQSVEAQFTIASVRGLDYLAITDHDDITSQSDPEWGAGGVIAIPGYEISLEGHAQMLGATKIYPKGDDLLSVRQLAAAIRGAKGIFQVNHPANGSTDWPHDTDWSYGYTVKPDTVEVWNISRLYQPPMPSGSSNDDAIAYWEGWLDRGARIGATGGSDNHWVSTAALQGPGQPTTWVFAEDTTMAAVLEGLERGRTFISSQPPAYSGTELYLEGDVRRDGSWAAMVGDVVDREVPLRVRVLGAPGAMLRVVGDGGEEWFDPVLVNGATFEHVFDAPSVATWVRAEVFYPDLEGPRELTCEDLVGSETTYCRNQLAVMAMTSAIFLR